MTRVAARAPTRVDLGGGWTDVPPYSEREGGFVCNIAIDRAATAVLAGAPPARTSDPLRRNDVPLVEAALRRAGLDEVHVALHNDYPIGAGLGGSSAAGVALAAAIARWQGEELSRSALAERSRALEVEELRVAGGRQDHYAAAFGGALGLTFSDQPVATREIALDDAQCAELERRALVIYTGESRISAETITAVTSAYERNEHAVLRALARMKALAAQMADALARAQLDDVARLMGEHWTHQRSLHPAITTPAIDAIVNAAQRAGALGAKALGASGGGCVLVMARDDNVAAVRAAIASFGALIPFRIDRAGVESWRVEADG